MHNMETRVQQKIWKVNMAKKIKLNKIFSYCFRRKQKRQSEEVQKLLVEQFTDKTKFIEWK